MNTENNPNAARTYQALEVALMRIAEFPRSRSDEMNIETARKIARAALAYVDQLDEEDAKSHPACNCKWCDKRRNQGVFSLGVKLW